MNTYWFDTLTRLVHKLNEEPRTTPVFWTRITRAEYRKYLRANKRAETHDHRAMGEQANEVDA